MSTIEVLTRRFEAIGAAFTASDGPWRGAPRVDVDDASGFWLGFAGRGPEADAEVVHIDPADRHLLLLVRSEEGKSKFLCGHDERHWFVAAWARTAERQRRGYQPMPRDPEVYARGSVRHPDHATLVLPGWHRVVMNTEQSARAMRHVIFID